MSLKELNLESFDTSSVSNMEFMFCHAESLILLNLYNFDTSSVTTMSSMF
jgi:surface protein